MPYFVSPEIQKYNSQVKSSRVCFVFSEKRERLTMCAPSFPSKALAGPTLTSTRCTIQWWMDTVRPYVAYFTLMLALGVWMRSVANVHRQNHHVM